MLPELHHKYRKPDVQKMVLEGGSVSKLTFLGQEYNGIGLLWMLTGRHAFHLGQLRSMDICDAGQWAAWPKKVMHPVLDLRQPGWSWDPCGFMSAPDMPHELYDPIKDTIQDTVVPCA